MEQICYGLGETTHGSADQTPPRREKILNLIRERDVLLMLEDGEAGPRDIDDYVHRRKAVLETRLIAWKRQELVDMYGAIRVAVDGHDCKVIGVDPLPTRPRLRWSEKMEIQARQLEALGKTVEMYRRRDEFMGNNVLDGLRAHPRYVGVFFAHAMHVANYAYTERDDGKEYRCAGWYVARETEYHSTCFISDGGTWSSESELGGHAERPTPSNPGWKLGGQRPRGGVEINTYGLDASYMRSVPDSVFDEVYVTKGEATQFIGWPQKKESEVRGGGMQSRYLATSTKPAGMLLVGNIDLDDRPVYRNDDGSFSTVYSMSFSLGAACEVLVPRVARCGGEAVMLSKEGAVSRYRATGQHLGVFDTAERATEYALALHLQQEAALPDLRRRWEESRAAGMEIVRHGPGMEHRIEREMILASVGTDVAQHFHHFHREESPPAVEHCGGPAHRARFPELDYEIRHCPCGRHAIDSRLAIGHDEDLRALVWKFSEPCPAVPGAYHLESGLVAFPYMPQVCVRCGRAPARFRCKRCRKVWLCSDACWKEYWARAHRSDCAAPPPEARPRYMTFPAAEHDSVRAQLRERGWVGTTRVADEMGKWLLDEVVDSPFGRLRVYGTRRMADAFRDNPYREDIAGHREWVRELSGRPGDYLWLRPAQ